ncbi:MAG TPA: hypothetical protein VHT91_27410 [Kofleriaceae bacterium]|jgi:hypothetical protein|nr:hypothetical protein [Kofleriaceae bacterium]
MNRNAIVLALGATGLLSGCVGDGSNNDDSVSTATQNLVVAPNAFVALHVTPAGAPLSCASNEVMIGIHLAQGRVICAALNFGYKVQLRYTDPPAPNGTSVGSSPVMHGCAPNFFIQAVHLMGPGQDESLDCVALETADNVALTYSSTYQDRNSPPTASVATYNISPNMHVCRPNFAMVGIHQSQNNLFCAD